MTDLKQLILDRVNQRPSGQVWTPVDFLDLGTGMPWTPRYGKKLHDDLRTGLATLPAWMQGIVRKQLSRDRERQVTPRRSRRIRVSAKAGARRVAASCRS